MDYVVIGLAALIAAFLTLYSGFGLGTVMLPAFALFFPAPVAVAAAAAVHLLNNLFKGVLLWRKADWGVALRFGLPAIPAAILGAFILSLLAEAGQIFTWSLAGREFGPTPASLTIGLLMITFAILELQAWFQRLAAPVRFLPLGGLATGFLGGLTGHQGALRSMFLLKAGLSAQRFVATGVMIAVAIDVSRLPTYAASLAAADASFGGRDLGLVTAGTLAAFAGAYLGAHYLEKITLGFVRAVVTALMLAIGAAMAAGIVGS